MDRHNITCQHPSFCYDRLINKCDRCRHMQRGSRKETTTVFGTTSITTQPVQVHPGNQHCSALIFVFCALVVLVIIMATLWLVIMKQRRKRRRKTGKNSQENGKCICFLANEAQTNHDCGPGDNDLRQLRCPHLNGVTMITHDDVLKENMPCVALTSQEVDVISLSPHDENCNSSFPVPATELGATVLVTTKTIQENILSKELP
ncbi:uncharacterized protein LOC113430804 [Notechis scutatus]|uniref:Uncharacterized protein LOC113430804 n=1 Tax=Notechis scutatus TaxID=8663 RepID=A0A6J1W828_9SAUR|nr:uncharacterized protein LOC113430804 [Notechis scutatus]